VAVLAATLAGPAPVLALLPRTLNPKLLQQLTEEISARRHRSGSGFSLTLWLVVTLLILLQACLYHNAYTSCCDQRADDGHIDVPPRESG